MLVQRLSSPFTATAAPFWPVIGTKCLDLETNKRWVVFAVFEGKMQAFLRFDMTI